MTLEAYDAIEGVAIPTKIEALQQVERAVQFNADGNKGHASFWEVIIWINANHAWLALDYSSLDEMWDARFAHLDLVVPRKVRPGTIESFLLAGQRQQQIADKIGVHVNTVANDISNHKIVVSGLTATNSRGQERPSSYNTKPKDERTDTPHAGPEEKEMPATMEHRSPFAAGEAIRDFGNGTVITAGENGLAESTAESVAMALDWYRGNPTGETAECESATGVSERVAERSRAALIDNKEIPDPKPNHLVANFDSIAQGLTYVADDLDSMTADLERATAEDLEFGREYFEDAMKKLNAFRKLLNAKY